MVHLKVIMNGNGAWPDLSEKLDNGNAIFGGEIEIAALPHGMKSGRPSVVIRIDTPDGRTVIAETSMATFQACARAFKIRYGD